ncbi:hypothetical protein [Pseudomonas oryzihabitans]|uniref:hypothetical protein n=1 Tax=Pseudomonas oryzihabitans TaxID=47885 RepID=UPI0011A3AB0D|nr:hypothetical protein [Pseudomonas psychrotolerans]
MRVFANYQFKGHRSSIELPEKLVQLFNEKYPNQSIGRFITKILKDEKVGHVGSSFVLAKLIEVLV